MADDPLANAVETFSAPIESLIIALGQGIAQAQQAMDQNSIQQQEAIDSNPVLAQRGLQATWYQMPRVDLQLKLSLTIAQDQPSGGGGPAPPLRMRLVAQPISASFQTHFSYDAQAASQVTLSIVPVPQPQAGAPPRMAAADVQAAALGTAAAKFLTVMVAGRLAPAPTDAQSNVLRFDVNFNSASRTWYALQYAPATPAVKPTAVAVDDATGAVRVISGG